LLIDDEPKVAETLKACLSNEFEVDIASCGSEALNAIKAGTRYDAVLCDFVMPKMNGVEFLKNLREIDPTLADRTVMMTGMLGSDPFQALGADFACPLLQKPFHPEKARDILLEIIRKESPER
jgi:two-component system NtrC family sensor kinase